MIEVQDGNTCTDAPLFRVYRGGGVVKPLHTTALEALQILRNLFWAALTGHDPEQRWREGVFRLAAHQDNSVAAAQAAAQTDGGDKATNATA